MDLNTFIPKYIKQVIAYRDRGVVTAERWNELWNLTITQGDYNSEAVKDVIDALLLLQTNYTGHATNINNPHQVTKEQVGLGNVSNDLQATAVDFLAHTGNISNPHTVTKAQVGLGNADDTADIVKNVLSATKLTTARKIGDALFDGSADITAAQIGVYTKTELQTSGQSVVDWANIANKPNLADGSWKPSVADRASLPLVGNVVGDQRVVLNDGDGKQAIYTCTATVGTVNQQWAKVGDVDWMSDEQTRVTNENARVAAETTRDSNEVTRVNSESTRVTNENTRVSNELARQAHYVDYTNPHQVTKSQVGLGNVDNTADANKPISTATQTALNDKVSKTTPQLAGELDQNSNTIGGAEFDNSVSGTAKTIDWKKGNHQAITINSDCTLTFVAPTRACMLSLRILYAATNKIITWPTIKWGGKEVPTFSTTGGAIDILSLYYDGTNYYGQAGINFG